MTALLDYLGDDRHYHTFGHVGGMINGLAFHFPNFNNSLNRHVIAYHDCKYNFGPSEVSNERLSANAARKELAERFSESELDELDRRIMLTVDHELVDENDEHGAVIIDLDLQELGTIYYRRNSDRIRKEYHMATDEQWREGRIAFLEKFLAKDSIYKTPLGKAQWEVGARHNLQKELDSFTKGTWGYW